MEIVQNNTMYLKDIIITQLPENFKVKYSLNCDGTTLTYLPDGLEVGGDLILGDAYIEDLPSRLIVAGDLYLSKEIKVPEDALIGGMVHTPERTYFPKVPKENLIITDENINVIYKEKKVFMATEQNDLDDFFYPEIIYYKRLNPNSCWDAVQYTEGEKTFILACSNIKKAKHTVNWHRAEQKGIYNYPVDLDTPKTVDELKEIYQVCTGACEKGIKKFLKEFKIDLDKKYTIRQVREMIMHLPFPGGFGKKVFLEYFDPNKIKET